MIETLRELVEHDSPSADKPRADALARLLAAQFAVAGALVEAERQETAGDHLVVSWPESAEPGSGPVLVVAHHDTVWPAGTAAARPPRIAGDRFYGPGALDMKASLVMAREALAAIAALGPVPRRPIRLLVTSDEEVGSPSSRPLIERQAREASAALVLEPPLPGGALKTARKGVGRFRVVVEGRAAHAGLEPEKGVNAIVELARQVVVIDALAAEDEGTTVNVGLIGGGTSRNTVPAEAAADVDVRVWTTDEAERVESAIRALAAHHPEARIAISGGFHRPPMERNAAGLALMVRAREIAGRLGQELAEGAAGGAGDANLISALGVGTLDGLGAIGGGAHAAAEHVELSSLVPRTELLAALMLEL